MSIVLPIRKRFILDKIPKSLVVAAYSTMRLTKEYNGPCVRVRRSSDNVEKDIYFNFENLLNFSDFVGFNGTYVRTWYDQVVGITPNNQLLQINQVAVLIWEVHPLLIPV
jgi:hypothetical protein